MRHMKWFYSSKSSIGTSYSIRKIDEKVKQMVRDNQSSGINRWCFYPIEKQLGMIEEDPNTSPVVMDQFETYLIDEGFKVKKKILLILHRNQLLKNWWSYTMTRTQKILLWPGTFANYSVKNEKSLVRLSWPIDCSFGPQIKRTFHDSWRVLLWFYYIL